MRTVKEVSKLTGVSVRTLHHYDAIGLLKPAEVTRSGYRLYDDTALSRLQTILLFRELQFPLKEIKVILDSPNFNQSEALEQQIHLLELQRQHITELISFAREIQKKGADRMEFCVFDTSEIEQYKEEVKSKWGGSEAYQEYKEKHRGGREFEKTEKQMMELFAELGKLRDLPPENQEVQKKIGELQSFITEHYYTCTDQIFRSLGQMYTEDQRFQQNIDRAGGDGTAEFARQAIELYSSRQ